MSNKYYFFLCIILILGCNSKQKETTLFIGAYRALDLVIPYPFLLEKTKDSLSFYNYKGDLLDRRKQGDILKKDTIILGDKEYLVLKEEKEKLFFFDLADTLNFPVYKGQPNWKYGATFTAVEKNTLIESVSKIRENLTNTIWLYDVIEDENDNPNDDFKIQKVYSFADDTVIELTNYYYNEEKITSEYQQLNYDVFKVGDKKFLSFSKTADNPQPIFQIIASSESKIEFRDYSSFKLKDKHISIKKSNITDNEYRELLSVSKVYENCFDGFQGQYYHANSTIYKKGNEFLKNYLATNPVVEDLNKSGFVILHFNVNCNEKIGDFGLIQMTRAYKKTTFSKDLIKHIVKKIASLKDWSEIVPEKEWSIYKDEHAFLMLKIENGKIIDICP